MEFGCRGCRGLERGGRGGCPAVSRRGREAAAAAETAEGKRKKGRRRAGSPRRGGGILRFLTSRLRRAAGRRCRPLPADSLAHCRRPAASGRRRSSWGGSGGRAAPTAMAFLKLRDQVGEGRQARGWEGRREEGGAGGVGRWAPARRGGAREAGTPRGSRRPACQRSPAGGAHVPPPAAAAGGAGPR